MKRATVLTLQASLVAVVVAGAAPAQEEITLRIQTPTVELTTGSEFDAAVLLDSTVGGIQGFSFGVAHDPAVLELVDAEIGPAIATINNGGPPDFNVISTEPSVGAGVTIAEVFRFLGGITLEAGEGYELLTMHYRVVGDPTQVDPCEPIVSALTISDQLGDPPVSVVVTVLGDSRTPSTVEGPLTVRCPGSMEITRCEGDTENVYLEWIFGGSPEWDFLFLYRNGELLASLDVDATGYDDLGLEPGDYVYTLVTFVVDDPTSPTLVFAHCTATVIPVTIESVEPGIGYWVGGDQITVTGLAFTSAETTNLFFFGGEGEEPLALEVVEVRGETELTAITPEASRLGLYGIRLENERGSAELADAFEYGFIRGEVNADREVDLSDAIYILTFSFVGGVAPPRCFDAMDTNDDGERDISDAILVLTFLFVGAAPPPPPFPGPGPDPTPGDPFGCLDNDMS